MTQPFQRPTPWPAAVRHLRAKGLMPTSMRTAELAELSAEIRSRAVFSAGVDRADILQRVKDLTDRTIAPEGLAPGQNVNTATFRKEMRGLLANIGYEVRPDGGLTDITSDRRLNLIARMNAGEARGYGQHTESHDPALQDAFPAQELFRLHYRKAPRQWYIKWADAGGEFYGGRMIALKDDPIWTRSIDAGGFNRFGRAWPPYDFNSGMWIRPVARGEARRLGLPLPPRRAPATRPAQASRPAPARDFAPSQQSCAPLADFLQALLIHQLGSRIRIEAGVAHLLPGAAP